MTFNSKPHHLFITLFFLFIISGVWWLLQFNRGDMVLLLNEIHRPFLDSLFSSITYLGHGLVYAAAIIALSFKRLSYSITALASFLITTVAVQCLKHLVFADVERPIRFFKDKAILHFIDNVNIHAYHSFPSGHTATAFSMFLILSLFFNHKVWGILFFALALMVAISRVYLAQHFFIDTYCGAILGIIITYLSYLLINRYSYFRQKDWMNHSLAELIWKH